MKREIYKIGDVLCDMHYGYKYLPDNLVIDSFLSFDCDSRKMITAMFPNIAFDNKYLVVVSDEQTDLLAAYSYDGQTLGLVKLSYRI